MSGAWVQTGDPVSSITAIRPTFLEIDKVEQDDSWKGPEVYGNTVNFAPNFFTNSVFADTYAAFGLWGWLHLPAVRIGWLLHGQAGTGFAIGASAGIMAYCFVEVWRIQIVSCGFCGLLLLLTLWDRRSSRLGGRYAEKWPGSAGPDARHDEARLHRRQALDDDGQSFRRRRAVLVPAADMNRRPG